MGNSNPSFIKQFFSKLVVSSLILLVLFTSLLSFFFQQTYKSKTKEIEDLENKILQTAQSLKDSKDALTLIEYDLKIVKREKFRLSENYLREVLKFVTDNTGIKEEVLPKVNYVSREEFAQRLKKDLEANKPKEEDIDTTRILLQTFGLIDKNQTNQQILDEMLESQSNFPIAFYDSTKQELTFITGATSSIVYYKYILAHELTHYVHDRKYNLEKRKKELEDSATDKYYPFLAIVEGNAEKIADKYSESLSKREMSELKAAFQEVGLTANNLKISKFDALWSEFVYFKGKEFIKLVSDDVNTNELLSQNTITSESIYNPKEFLKQNTKFKGEKLVDFNYLNTQFKVAEEDIFGEFGCNIVIYSLKDKSNNICSGWNGDKIKLFKKDKEFVLVYATVWDSPIDLAEAFIGFNDTFKSLDLKYDKRVTDNTLLTIISNDSSLNLSEELKKIQLK